MCLCLLQQFPTTITTSKQLQTLVASKCRARQRGAAHSHREKDRRAAALATPAVAAVVVAVVVAAFVALAAFAAAALGYSSGHTGPGILLSEV